MHDSFKSVSAGGLRQDLLPVRLYQLAKAWFWDPTVIDFTQDQRDWQQLNADQQQIMLQLAALFAAGEEAARHVEFFSRFLAEIGIRDDLHRFHSESYRRIFHRALPPASRRPIACRPGGGGLYL